MSALKKLDFILLVNNLSTAPVHAPTAKPKFRAHVRVGKKRKVDSYTILRVKKETLTTTPEIEIGSYGKTLGDVRGLLFLNASGLPQINVIDDGSLTPDQAETHLYAVLYELIKKVQKGPVKVNPKYFDGFYIKTQKPGIKPVSLLKAVDQKVISQDFADLMKAWEFTMAEY